MNVYTIVTVVLALSALSEAEDQDNGPLISALHSSTGLLTDQVPTNFALPRHKRQYQEDGPVVSVIKGFKKGAAQIFERISRIIVPQPRTPYPGSYPGWNAYGGSLPGPSLLVYPGWNAYGGGLPVAGPSLTAYPGYRPSLPGHGFGYGTGLPANGPGFVHGLSGIGAVPLSDLPSNVPVNRFGSVASRGPISGSDSSQNPQLPVDGPVSASDLNAGQLPNNYNLLQGSNLNI